MKKIMFLTVFAFVIIFSAFSREEENRLDDAPFIPV
jgi:hypothetical protein